MHSPCRLGSLHLHIYSHANCPCTLPPSNRRVRRAFWAVPPRHSPDTVSSAQHPLSTPTIRPIAFKVPFDMHVAAPGAEWAVGSTLVKFPPARPHPALMTHPAEHAPATLTAGIHPILRLPHHTTGATMTLSTSQVLVAGCLLLLAVPAALASSRQLNGEHAAACVRGASGQLAHSSFADESNACSCCASPHTAVHLRIRSAS